MGARRGLKVGQALACLMSSSLSAQVPRYVTGDECLFCHRVKVADTWEKNPHARTVHPREDSDRFPSDAAFVLGAHPPQRGLRPDGYGKFDLLSADGKNWDKQTFALRCAGCHTTAVDPETHAFSTSSLDCYTCHGVAPENHPNDTSLIWFSKKHAKDPKQIVSICGQCHLRDGKAKSNGLPYPDNFVAGDDLFAGFQIDFAKADDQNLNPADRHILRNARDVILHGGDVTCISCHRIHDNTSAKHPLVQAGPICLDCHNPEGPKSVRKKYTVHSDLCEY
jgi:hypothetical protein